MQAMVLKALIACAIALGRTADVAQRSRAAADGARAPRPEGASNARVGGWCDALTGEKKERCLREESRKLPERGATKGELLGSCDAMVGQDKEHCLRQGGTIEVDARRNPSGAEGATAASQ